MCDLRAQQHPPHEAVGVVEEVGAAVTAFHPSDRVIVSCISSCGKCDYCRRLECTRIASMVAGILGNTIDGTQAEYVHISLCGVILHAGVWPRRVNRLFLATPRPLPEPTLTGLVYSPLKTRTSFTRARMALAEI
jgi:hypothetical protein